MAQASPELRDKWHGPSEEFAIEYLENRGYTLTKEYEWLCPANTVPTEKDLSAIQFLFEEWDFGGIVDRT